MTSDNRKIIGLNFKQLLGKHRQALTTALRNDPAVLVIYSPSFEAAELQVVQVAYQSGHEVLLVQSPEKAPSGTDWLSNLVE